LENWIYEWRSGCPLGLDGRVYLSFIRRNKII
jgi:hypothetical protein